MTTVDRTAVKYMRIWPGIVFPIGLTLLLALAAWQFAVSVSARQERADAEGVRLENRARAEAGALSSRARSLVESFVQSRLAERRKAEEILRVELRGVMESVYRVLGACLESSRRQAAVRRDVGDFPSGFEGVRNYLELSRASGGADRALTALRGSSPELGALLPSGYSLAVIENNAVEIFSIGGGAHGDGGVSLSMNREFVWSDGSENRNWTLLLRLNAPDANPMPDAAELVNYLGAEMGRVRFDSMSWRGWLVRANGENVAAFPEEAVRDASGGVEPPPFTNSPDEWVDIDGRRLVWLERPVRIPDQELTPAVAVSIARPAPPLDLVDEFLNNRRWSFTLGALALWALGMWVWFVRGMALSRRAGSRDSAGAAGRRVRARAAASAGADEPPRRRLVRDVSAGRAIPDVEGVIVADIDADGQLKVTTLEAAQALLAGRRARPAAPAPLPSGSLFRLQARHRGGKGRPGSRVLDQARSPILRKLAARVRPVTNASGLESLRRAASREASGETVAAGFDAAGGDGLDLEETRFPIS